MSQNSQIEKIQRIDIFNIRFYEKSPFYGSFRGMHYKIEKVTDETDKEMLCVTTWPGPFNFDHTEEHLKETAHFEFSNSGLDAIISYLNQYHQTHDSYQ